jgi:hypothetical protein
VVSIEQFFQVPEFLPPQYLRMIDAPFLGDDRQEAEERIYAFSLKEGLQLSQIELRRVCGRWQPFNNGTPRK